MCREKNTELKNISDLLLSYEVNANKHNRKIKSGLPKMGFEMGVCIIYDGKKLWKIQHKSIIR